MVNPVPGKSVTTPYKKKGLIWRACGWHTGQDYAAPVGTKVVAARAGRVKHVNYGSAFGNHQVAVQCKDGTEDFYAHMNSRVADGTWVRPNEKVGTVGVEGNVTGPHLHFERHKRHNVWRCDNMLDPMLSHKDGTMEPGKVYLSKLTFGESDSNSVRRLQEVLNKVYGTNLPLSGNYLTLTRDAVSGWQKDKAADKSITDGQSLNLYQANQIFADSGHTVVNDVPEEPEQPDDEQIIQGLGIWEWYSGKPKKDKVVYPDGEWHKLFVQPPSGIKAKATDFHFLYLRILLPANRTAARLIETRFIRSDGDGTAYDSREYGTVKNSVAYHNNHFEDGDGLGGTWYVKVTGGKSPITLTTRYAKTHVHYQEENKIT